VKVVTIITGLDLGGAETMLLNLLERLDERFARHVISLTTVGVIGERLQALEIPVESLGMRSEFPNPSSILRLARRIRQLDPDLVHTWMYHADLLGGIAARLAGVRAVAWSIRNTELDHRTIKRTTRAVARMCAVVSGVIPDLILSCSEVAKRAHVAYGYPSAKILVVPNGFDLIRFQPTADARSSVRSELNLSGNTPIVGLIARYDPLKNHPGFFEMARVVHRLIPQVHFVLAGSRINSDNAELLRLASDAGVAEVTHLLGPRSDIPRLMAALDVLVSSSHGEAFPNVLGEAMASGVPCAVTDVGDSAYIVGDTGRVVKRDDMDGLAAAAADLLSMPSVARCALGMQARARVAENFNIDEVVIRYEGVYEGMVRASRTRRAR
jgi:glycosyltransferase involved in cell wall biosynthesis